jgi:BirA family biotin operon repressor/biotin-[acetyl-CoA-carboxylase] ligase
VVGIGINVDQTADELPVPGATSLSLAASPRDRVQLFGDVLGRLRATLATTSARPGSLVDDYRPLCDTLGQTVRVDLPGGAVLEGRADDVDEHGRLVVRTADHAVAVAAGDVVHVRPAG